MNEQGTDGQWVALPRCQSPYLATAASTPLPFPKGVIVSTLARSDITRDEVATVLRGALGPRYQVENSTSDADSLVVRKVKLGWLFRAHVLLERRSGQIELRVRPGGT
jgi:hypothetical protein